MRGPQIRRTHDAHFHPLSEAQRGTHYITAVSMALTLRHYQSCTEGLVIWIHLTHGYGRHGN